MQPQKFVTRGISEALTTGFKVDKVKRVKRRKANLAITMLVNLISDRSKQKK